ncbi:FadR/GntR family transcriptional regulator [Lacibacterium aquatile]|uniref:FadR/GntR family transcriptional regulator n=1 Tax=Lacibacterium aquatile TaxID=1168082 RepID=A0ABW5DVT1_9PROT
MTQTAARRTYSKRSLHGQVAHDLGRRIIGGSYPEGSLLPNEEELSTELDVSRTALREAIKVLTAKGLIVSRPKIGTKVRPRGDWNMLDPDVLEWTIQTSDLTVFSRKLIEMRDMIEPAAAGLAARNHRPEQAVELVEAYRAMDASQTHQDWSAADLRFHQAMLSATGNELVGALGTLIETALITSFDYSARHARKPKESLILHRDVLDAILSRDPAAATQAMEVLLTDAREAIDRIAAAQAGS